MSTASIVFAIIVIILSGCVDSNLEKELRAQQEHYCDMVRLHVESEGEYGWSDHKRNFEEVCK